MNHLPLSFPMDGSSLYFMAQAAPDHTNVYRICLSLKEPVCPQALQAAVDRVHARFPTLFAGFRPGAFDYTLVPSSQPPRVQPDPGLLLTMPEEELTRCAYRVYYKETHLILELFHALTDGTGALTSLRALLGEYLHLRHGIPTPERDALLLTPPQWEAEWEDGYLHHSGGSLTALPRRNSYRIPGGAPKEGISTASCFLSTETLRQAAKNAGVSVTVLLSALMAEAVMEVQSHCGKAKEAVRIMVPVDLRRQFPSRTLRNFVLYALPTLAPDEAGLPLKQRLQSFKTQLRQQLDRDFLAGQIARNQLIQTHFLFRLLPTAWKFGLMRLSNRLFGESNSSITLTNLGPFVLSEPMAAHVEGIQVFLTPRRRSPYNCGLISFGDTTAVTISRYGESRLLEDLFFGKLKTALEL